MENKKYLSLAFSTTEGKTATLRVPKVKNGVTPDEIKAAGKSIVDANVFMTNNGELAALKGAKVTTTQVEEII